MSFCSGPLKCRRRPSYHLSLSLKSDEEGRPSSLSCSYNILWKTNWGMNIQPKIRTFLWRLCNNSLPTRIRLSKRIEGIDTWRPSCLKDPKTGWHLFFSRKKIINVWNNCEVSELQLLDHCIAMSDVIHKLLQKIEMP